MFLIAQSNGDRFMAISLDTVGRIDTSTGSAPAIKAVPYLGHLRSRGFIDTYGTATFINSNFTSSIRTYSEQEVTTR